MELNIQLDDTMAYILASSNGWSPTIEDTSQEMIDDVYPLIANPISAQDFLEKFIPDYISGYVVKEAENKMKDEITSKYNSIVDAIQRWEFDEMLLSQNTDSLNQYIFDKFF